MVPAQYDLAGKVALVTGASRVNSHSSSQPAEDLVAELKHAHPSADALAIQADVSSLPSLSALFAPAKAHFGKIDIVLSNAGIEHFGPLESVTEEEFDKVYRTNVRAQFFVAQQAFKHLTRGGGGRLVLASSISKNYSIPNHSVYASSKGAIEAMVRNICQDFGPLGVTVNAVAPGGTWTDMAASSARHYIPGGEGKTDEEVKEWMVKASPLGYCECGAVFVLGGWGVGEWQTIEVAG